MSTGLPGELKFTELKFKSGRTLDGGTSRELQIWGAADSANKTFIDDYQEALTQMETGDGKALFSDVTRKSDRLDTRNKQTVVWSLTCEFNGE